MIDRGCAQRVLNSKTFGEVVEVLASDLPADLGAALSELLGTVKVTDADGTTTLHHPACLDGKVSLVDSPAAPPADGSLETWGCPRGCAGKSTEYMNAIYAAEHLRREIGAWEGMAAIDEDGEGRCDDHPVRSQGAARALYTLWASTTTRTAAAQACAPEPQGGSHRAVDWELAVVDRVIPALKDETLRRLASVRPVEWLWLSSAADSLKALTMVSDHVHDEEWTREITAARACASEEELVSRAADLTEKIGWVVVHSHPRQVLSRLGMRLAAPTGLTGKAVMPRTAATTAAVPAPVAALLSTSVEACPHGRTVPLTDPLPRDDAEYVADMVNQAQMPLVTRDHVAAVMALT